MLAFLAAFLTGLPFRFGVGHFVVLRCMMCFLWCWAVCGIVLYDACSMVLSRLYFLFGVVGFLVSVWF